MRQRIWLARRSHQRSVINSRLETLLNNLATILSSRFEHRASVSDLDEAISPASPVGEPLRRVSRCAGGAVEPLRSPLRAVRDHGDPQDIHDAIAAGRRALSLTSGEDWMRPVRLSNLSAALRTRYEALSSIADIDEAISLGQIGGRATPVNSPRRAEHLSVLGAALQSRWGGPGDAHDLEEALDAARQAVRATVAGSSIFRLGSPTSALRSSWPPSVAVIPPALMRLSPCVARP